MIISDENFAKLKELTTKENKGFSNTLHKVVEELGELSSIWLKTNGVESSQYKNFKDGNLEEEVIDLLMCVYSLAIILNIDEKQINQILREKLEKWSKNIV